MLVIGVVLTMGAAGLTYTQIPSRYQATARMILLLPANARGDELVGSPFLYLPNGLNVLARIVALTPTSRDFQALLYQQGLVSQYEVGVDNASPTITVTVEGTDPQNVVETRDRVIEAMNSELLVIQREENAPSNQIAHTRVYAAEPMPEQIGGSRLRGVLAVGGAGALLTLIVVFVIDRLAQVRVDRRARRLAVAGEAPPKRRARRDRSSAASPVDDTESSDSEESTFSDEESPKPGSGPSNDASESASLPDDPASRGESDGVSVEAVADNGAEPDTSPGGREPGDSALTRASRAVDVP